MQLTLKYRPLTFADVVGQEDAVDLLRSIVKRPESSPRTLLACGSHGCGKTSLARIFSRAMNCHFRGTGADACGKCEDCLGAIDQSPWYQEYDCSEVGNKEWFDNYKQQLEYMVPRSNRWLVVVFDEAHLISKAAQGSMLKLTEEAPPRVFFVMCSTDPENLTDTIRSRSLRVAVNKLSVDMIARRLQSIAAAEGIEVHAPTLRRIAQFSDGHMRDAVMQLDTYAMLPDKERFNQLIQSGERYIQSFLAAVRARNHEAASAAIIGMVGRPLAHIRHDWEQVVLDLVKAFVGHGTPTEDYTKLAAAYGQDCFRLLRALTSEWMAQAMTDDLLFQAAMWNLYYELGKTTATAGAVDSMAVFRKQ